MTLGRHHLQRFLVVTLLALMVSPLTAPFSAGHPLDLLDGKATHVQSKKGPDDPVVSLSIATVVLIAGAVVAVDITSVEGGPDVAPHTHALPLRL